MHKYKGAIIAHIGPMFGGKTSALLSDVRKMQIAKYNVQLFKPNKDTRYSENKIVNHNGESINSINIVSLDDIVDNLTEDSQVIAIDEFQFIKEDKFTIEQFLLLLMDMKMTLIISGLDLDSDLKPFKNTKELLPYATHIFKHKAVCVKCGNDATTSHCIVNKDVQEKIGGSDIYIPLCLDCYIKGAK